jgi:NitT/TauT family transport system ATP-binding protein
MRNGLAMKPRLVFDSAEPFVRVAGVDKVFAGHGRGALKAVDNVSFEIHAGEFISIVGPSGCGKSTLMMMVSGLTLPSAGEIVIDSKKVMRPYTNLGIVFQRDALLEWRTVLDNVLLPAEILGLDKTSARARAMHLLELVGLAGFEDRFPRELSGGMQQRASICRALIHDPSVLLMDEPFAALDAMTREELGFELMRIWDTDKKTVVFVTHNITEAILLADRVVAMSPRPGRIAKIVDIDLPRPRTIDMEFTSQFKSYSDQIRAVIYHGGGVGKR